MSVRRTGVKATETARIEAFSDGVFAIAITLLILDIRVPRDAHVELGHALVELWPAYLAFVSSFATIGIMWINHHRLFTMIQRSDHSLLIFNSLLLLGISFVPFPTALLSEYIGDPGERIAAMVYSGTFFYNAIIFNLLWRHASAGNRLIGAEISPEEVAAQTRQYAFGPVFYMAALLLAFVSVAISVAVNLLLALFFALPPRKSS